MSGAYYLKRTTVTTIGVIVFSDSCPRCYLLFNLYICDVTGDIERWLAKRRKACVERCPNVDNLRIR